MIHARAKESVQTIVAESTTLCHHLEANYPVRAYLIRLNFPDSDTFLSPSTIVGVTRTILSQDFPRQSSHRRMPKLPKIAQSSPCLTHTLKNKNDTRKNLLYSDSLFQEAAIEWLIATDQVIFFLFNLSLSMI
jgi:hypothetical protein